MRFVNSLCLTLAFALVCSVAVAQETSDKSEGQTCSKCPASASAEKSCEQCPVEAAMKNLPQMTYKVGDKSTCCSKSAATLAKDNDKQIQYVVAKKTYDKELEAYTALVESTETFVEKFMTPTKCEKSGKTSIAGASCNCPLEAGKKAELVKKAVSDIKMTYVVGETKCNCPNQAKSLAASSDEKTKYVVAGKETCCNLEARLNLAKAKYAAAVKALASAEKAGDKKVATTDS